MLTPRCRTGRCGTASAGDAVRRRKHRSLARCPPACARPRRDDSSVTFRIRYRGSVDVTQQYVEHGSLKIITVKDGQIGITFNDGVLEMLTTGRHTIHVATHTLAGFVSTGQQVCRRAVCLLSLLLLLACQVA